MEVAKVTANKEGISSAVHEYFHKYDKDSSGSIERQEIIPLLADCNALLGINTQISDAQISQVISLYDKNGDGKISKEEFAPFVVDIFLNVQENLRQAILATKKLQHEGDLKKTTAEVFQKLDRDSSGFLDRKEVESGLGMVIEGKSDAPPITGPELDNFFTKFDANGDGKISVTEFHEFVVLYFAALNA